ncbi:hypothetical protein CAPTEDRAFT_205308 [Capitella teleta]|uniref:Uncharacterized protein n=1 Tax=Capitella teleta TaxID=283909 RepID=R7TTF5_CAPTE|nr:hypothetical protein CAPTEDRAFT_205308 [Capitella teleta]|eukprot:ELT94756.1 hypothetical protein CAPTEDRAFT_205308 [Capitella teleta]
MVGEKKIPSPNLKLESFNTISIQFSELHGHYSPLESKATNCNLNDLIIWKQVPFTLAPNKGLELRRESAFNKATTVELCGTVTTRRRRDLVAKTGPRPLGPRGQLGSTKNQSTEDWPLEGRSARPLSRQRVQQQLTEDAKVNLRSVLVRKLPSELEAREVPALVVPEHSWMQDVPLLVGTNALRVGEGQAEQGALRVRLRKAVVLPPNATSTVEGEVDQLKAAQNSIVGEVGVLEMISQITLPAGFFQFPVYVIFSNKRGNPFRKTALNSLVFGNKFRSHSKASTCLSPSSSSIRPALLYLLCLVSQRGQSSGLNENSAGALNRAGARLAPRLSPTDASSLFSGISNTCFPLRISTNVCTD